MSTSKHPDTNTPRKASIPLWAGVVLGLFIWLVAVPVLHGVVPYLLSLVGPHYGWVSGRPSPWNLLGLLPMVAGGVILASLMLYSLTQISQSPDRITLDWSPKLFMQGGPYAYSRHPMYVGELAFWLGSTILYGSLLTFVGFLALCCLIGFVLVPKEERELEESFGDVYREYQQRVPKWFR